MRTTLSLFVSTLLVSLAAGSAACNKGGASTAAPADGAAAGGGKAEAAAGELLRYKPDTSFRQATTYTVKVSGGGQFGEVATSHKATLSLAPSGENIRVGWKVDELANIALKGMFEPKDASLKDFDYKAYLAENGTGVFLTDLRGEKDDEGTDALPENTEKKKAAEAKKVEREAAIKKAKEEKKDPPKFTDAAGEQVLAMLEPSFSLMTLPEKPMEVGKPVTEEEESEEEVMGGIKIPMETEATYTLVKIDESGGKRVAEISVEVEASGAAEMGQGMLVIDQATEATFLFNMDEGIPVSVNLNTTQSVSMGDRGLETSVIVESTYEPV